MKNFLENKLNLYLLSGLGTLLGLAIIGILWKDLYGYPIEFVKANILQLLVLGAGGLIIFFSTFNSVFKKSPKLVFVILYLVLLDILSVFIVSLPTILERLFNKAAFGQSTNLYTYITLLICIIIFSNMNLLRSNKLKEMYFNVRAVLLNELPLIFLGVFVVAFIGFNTGAVLFVLAYLISLKVAYICKQLLVNLKV